MQAQSCCSDASVRGGENSNESKGAGCAASRIGKPVKRGPVSQRRIVCCVSSSMTTPFSAGTTPFPIWVVPCKCLFPARSPFPVVVRRMGIASHGNRCVSDVLS